MERPSLGHGVGLLKASPAGHPTSSQPAPTGWLLSSAAGDPFKETTRLCFAAGKSSRISLTVYIPKSLLKTLAIPLVISVLHKVKEFVFLEHRNVCVAFALRSVCCVIYWVEFLSLYMYGLTLRLIASQRRISRLSLRLPCVEEELRTPVSRYTELVPGLLQAEITWGTAMAGRARWPVFPRAVAEIIWGGLSSYRGEKIALITRDWQLGCNELG